MTVKGKQRGNGALTFLGVVFVCVRSDNRNASAALCHYMLTVRCFLKLL